MAALNFAFALQAPDESHSCAAFKSTRSKETWVIVTLHKRQTVVEVVAGDLHTVRVRWKDHTPYRPSPEDRSRTQSALEQAIVALK